ncbi:FAD-dependent monooxygenase [Kitasatospora sp. NPDC059571]|uniref:FAD-dependent monooxygenase n=1 Tax=Kitasatospora sp. NPDC059571 TaxID=3346871 RepID=UPI00368C7782
MVDTDVLVAGAGPVGLTAAAELRRRGVDCRIVDRLAAPMHFAKAVGVQPRTLEIWDAMGIVREALAAAVPMRGQLTWVNGREGPRIDLALPPEVPYGFAALPQYATEELLTALLARHGTAVERGTELLSFEQDAEQVTAVLAGPGGQRTVRCRYLVGCDGAHSRVRKALGLAFEGGAFTEQYMLGDVELDWDLPAGYGVRSMRRAEDGTTEDLMVCIPLPGEQRYRISASVAPDLLEPADDTDDAVAHGLEGGRAPELRHIQAVLDRLAPGPATASALRWSSVFRISHRLVDRYRSGRVFVAGDAAHIHPPTGGQGMNTGIQDAYNLAWKLALAVRGLAGGRLLDSYDAERRPIGAEVVGRTVQHARQQRIGAEGDSLRTVLLREAQLLLNYRGGPLVAPDGAGPGAVRPGDRAPDCTGLRHPLAAFPLRLFDLLRGPRHLLLLHTGPDADRDRLAACADAAGRAARGELDTCAVVPPGAAADHLPVPAVADDGGAFRAAYAARDREAFLIRPDGYLAARVHPADPARLAAELSRTFDPA